MVDHRLINLTSFKKINPGIFRLIFFSFIVRKCAQVYITQEIGDIQKGGGLTEVRFFLDHNL
jgi:hypothetical protein